MQEGRWEAWTYGMQIRGWTLHCGRLEADIRQISPDAPYYLDINKHTYGNYKSLEEAQRAAEEHIASRIRSVFPAYRAIRARMRARSATGDNSRDA